MKDKNFDDLIDKFRDRIYESQKGQWRLTLLKEDLSTVLPAEQCWHVWDAGCGFAQMALWLAEKQHQLTLCDLSAALLQESKKAFDEDGLKADFHQQSFQTLAAELPAFDLVMSHAVLEWLAQPMAGLSLLINKVKPGGYLSLMFYNRNAMVYKNVIRGQWRLEPILKDSYIGKGNKLSPPNPLFPHEVLVFLTQAGCEVIQHTGIRVFHDYLSNQALKNSDQATLFALEKKYCRQPTYRDMGRYVHLLVRKPD